MGGAVSVLKSRVRVCRFCGDLHETGAWPHDCLEPAPARSDFPSPYIITDSMPGGVNGLFHHAACKKTDSKSEFRKGTKQMGCTELGSEYEASTKRPNVDIKPAVIESAVNETLHEMGISSESDITEDFTL